MRASTPPRRRRLRVLIPCVATLLSLLTGVPAAYAASTLVVTVPTDATHRYLGGWPIAIRSTSALDENHSYIHYTWPNMDETRAAPRSTTSATAPPTAS